MKTEKDLQQFIKKLCRKNSIGYFKIHCEGQTGFPDLLLVYKGHTVFIEVKSPKGTGRISARQIILIDDLRAKGQEVYVIDTEEKAGFIIEDFINREPKQSNRPSL